MKRIIYAIFLGGLKVSTINKLYGIVIIFLLSINITFSQQVIQFGLDGRNVNDIKFYNGYLFVATDSGVYKRYIEDADSVWINIGLKNKKVNVVYPHDFGPIGWTVSAGVSPTFTPGDSALIYCNCDPDWVIADSGIDRSKITSIKALGGFPSPVICGETFAGADGKLYRRGFSSWYKEIYDTGGLYKFNVIKTDLSNGSVWIGGETGIFQPFIAKSTDKGDTWKTSFPDLGGDNACNSIELVQGDTNTIYAGMEGLVIKTTDGGASWDSTGLVNTPYYFNCLAYDDFSNILYAGGSTGLNKFGLFYSNDRGKTWTEIQTLESYKGITSMALVPTQIEQSNLYIATSGSGVLWLTKSYNDVDEKSPLEKFELQQNYPNPFNPSTKIKFVIPKSSFVNLKVYNVLGKEVATLVNEEKHPGSYEVEFDGSDLSSGIYFYKLQAGNYIDIKKMVVIK